ncbi:MAG: DUF4136 domain-containing protein [Cyclobacteriaceae bacterium]|nr:DUF4136 domain-containing protein [Cyclobacteriaceae bacterium]
MYTFFKSSLLIILALFALAGCYPKGPEYYSDIDLTITDYDMNYDFGAQRQYYMADTIAFSTNIEDNELDEISVAKLLEAIERNMEMRGYERLTNSEIYKADFVLTVSVIATQNVQAGFVPFPPYYPGWGWDIGWGGYYPPYWGGYYAYSYTKGSVIINWWDPQIKPSDLSSKKQQPIHWLAALNGLVSDSKNSNTTRVENGIDQAFKQSPYIKSTL